MRDGYQFLGLVQQGAGTDLGLAGYRFEVRDPMTSPNPPRQEAECDHRVDRSPGPDSGTRSEKPARVAQGRVRGPQDKPNKKKLAIALELQMEIDLERNCQATGRQQAAGTLRDLVKRVGTYLSRPSKLIAQLVHKRHIQLLGRCGVPSIVGRFTLIDTP